MQMSSRWRSGALFGVTIVLLSACPEESGPDGGADAGAGSDATSTNDAATPDTASPDVALPDTALPDTALPDAAATDTAAPDTAAPDAASAADAGTDASVLPVPVAPIISSPQVAAVIGSPVRVTGTGEVGLTLTVTVLQGSVPLGTLSGAVEADGSFRLDVTYTAPAPGTALIIQAVQENASGVSAPAEVAVAHQPSQLSGSVSQNDGPGDGTRVMVRLYQSDEEILYHLQEQILTVTDGQLVPPTAYSFSVGDGSYYVRAFRDADGPDGTGPDGHPTMTVDPQASAIGPIVVAGGDSSDNDLTLTNVSDLAVYTGLQVYTYNESGWPEPPRYETSPGSDVWLEGPGLCRGYHMQLSARAERGAAGGSPQVLTPGRGVVELLDDGGCGAAVADNSDQSYDGDLGDGNYALGWPDPDDSDAGDYLLFFRNTSANVIHIESDPVDPVLELDRYVPLTSPTGAEVGTPTSTLQWDPVPGAGVYKLYLESGSDDLGNSGFISQTSFQPNDPLPDDAAVDVWFELFDVDPTAGAYDARANSVESRFITDADGLSSVFISGDIVNDSGQAGRYNIFAVDVSGRAGRSMLWLPPTATSFTIATLATDRAQLQAFIDVDGSGDDASPVNQAYTLTIDNLDATSDVSGTQLHFTWPLNLLSPAHGAGQTGDTPAFSWEDYTPHAPAGAWSYILLAQVTGAQGWPPIIVGVPSSVTSFDLANLPSGYGWYDSLYFVTCRQTGGTVEDRTCNNGTPTASLTDLSSATTWEWSLAVIECDYADYANNVDDDQNGVDDFNDCAENLGPGVFYSWSPENMFTTD